MNDDTFCKDAASCHMAVTKGLLGPAPWKSVWHSTQYRVRASNADLGYVSRKLYLFLVADRSVIRETGILFALCELIAYAGIGHRAIVAGATGVGDLERLTTGAQVIDSMSHKLETHDYLFQPCRYNWRVDVRRKAAGHAHTLELLHHDGVILTFTGICQPVPDRRHRFHFRYVAVSKQGTVGFLVGFLDSLGFAGTAIDAIAPSTGARLRQCTERSR